MLDIKVTPAVVYEVVAPNGTTVVFRRSSTWEGFEKWDCELGSMIVTNTMDRGPFSEMFRNVFKFDKPEASETYRVLRASPSLISLFDMEIPKTEKAAG